MHITRVEIQNFKRITSIDFSLGSVNVFIGGNNSGKTSVIQAAHFAFTLFQSLTVANKWPAATKKSVSISPAELIYVPSDNPYHLGTGGRLLEAADSGIGFSFYFQDGNQVNVTVRKGRINNILVEPDNIDYAREISSLSKPFSVYSPGLAGVARSEVYVSDGVLLRALARGDANAFLRNILYRLHKTNDWANFESSLASLFPEAHINVNFNTDIDQFINVSIKEPGREVPIDLAGTGLLQAIQILSYYLLFRPKLIILDEPDSHLHPNNQRLMCSLLLSLSLEENVQILATTHSRHVLDAMHQEAKILWLEGGGIRPAAMDQHADILLELGALDIKERIENSNARFLFLTEDRLSGPFVKIIGRSGFNREDYILYPYNGVKTTDLLRPLVNHIRSLTNAEIIVHRDRDYMEPDEAEVWKREIRSLGAEPFLTQGRDIEDYFCSADFIAEFGRDVEGFNLHDFLIEVGDGENEKAIESYINGRIDVEKKRGNFGGLNVGALAVRAAQEANRDVLNLLKGKQKLPKIRRLFQEKYGARFDLDLQLNFDIEPELVAIRRRAIG